MTPPTFGANQRTAHANEWLTRTTCDNANVWRNPTHGANIRAAHANEWLKRTTCDNANVWRGPPKKPWESLKDVGIRQRTQGPSKSPKTVGNSKAQNTANYQRNTLGNKNCDDHNRARNF